MTFNTLLFVLFICVQGSTLISGSNYLRSFAQFWHKAGCMQHPLRLVLAIDSLLFWLTDHCTIRGAFKFYSNLLFTNSSKYICTHTHTRTQREVHYMHTHTHTRTHRGTLYAHTHAHTERYIICTHTYTLYAQTNNKTSTPRINVSK